MSTEVIGHSNEGREMLVAKVGRQRSDGQKKPAIFIEGGERGGKSKEVYLYLKCENYCPLNIQR